MKIVANRFRGAGLQIAALSDLPFPGTAPAGPPELLGRCPRARETPLPTTPSGTAGVSALPAARAEGDALQLDDTSCVLAILSEGAA